MPSARQPPSNYTFEPTPIRIENSLQIACITTSALSIAIPTLLVALRFYVRRAIAHRPIDASDWCSFAGLLANIALHVDMYVMVLMGGFGHHTIEIFTRWGPDVAMHFFKGILAFPMIWNLTVCLSKLSVLFMYANVIPVEKMIWACKGLGLFIILWNSGGVLGALLICRPFAFNWDKTIEGTCGDLPLYYTWLGAINVVVEAIMLMLPIPFLFNLQLKLSRKLLVIALFSIGWMTCAVSIYRQATLPGLDFRDMPFVGVPATILTGVEPAVALSLACVPFLKALIHRGTPGSTAQSGSGYGSGFKGSKGSKGGLSSRSRSGSHGRHFQALHDDSSEIRLQPVGRESGYQGSAEVGPRSESVAGIGNAIVVKTQWEVKTKGDNAV